MVLWLAQLSRLDCLACEVTVISCCTYIIGANGLRPFENIFKYFGLGGDVGDEMLLCIGSWIGSSRELHSMKSSPRLAECDALRLQLQLIGTGEIDLRNTPLSVELNLRATMLSSTDLKSSRKTVSDAHLKTRVNLQYGLMPLLVVSFAALTTTSMSRKAIENAMQSNMTPKRVLIPISTHKLNPYVFLIAATSLQVV
jgi:hypothetical protein